MGRLRRFLFRIRNAFGPFKAEYELAREVDAHLQLMEDEFQRRGLTPQQARSAARKKFGGVEQTKEQHRDARSFVRLDDVRRDVAYALRMARRNPGFALLGVAILALAIGANTAIFAIVDAVLLKPLPYSDPDRIVTLSNVIRSGPLTSAARQQVADADVLDWRSQATSFEALTYYSTRAAAVMVGEQAEYARVSQVSGDFFRVLGVRAIAGRLFGAQELKAGALTSAIVSSTFVRSHFGEAGPVIGRTMRLFNRSFTIVGIVPAGFTFPEGTEIWVPIPLPDAVFPLHRGGQNFRAAARLKAGLRLEQAQSEMTTIARRLEQQYPDSNAGRHVEVMGLQDQIVSESRLMLYVLLAAVGLILLIACTNLTTLLLARATARTQEITIRAALGADRGRIVRQMIVEGLVHGVAAGAAGLALAAGGLGALVAVVPDNVPRLEEIAVDGRVLLFTLSISVVASVLLAVAPALQASQVNIEGGLKQGASRSVAGSATRRLREALVVAQVAMAIVLLTGSGLLIKTFMALQHVELGFQPQHVLVADATVATPDPTREGSLFFRNLIAELSKVPGVEAAGATMAAPGRVDSTGSYWIDHVPQPNEMAAGFGPGAVNSVVAPGTFAALGIPLVEGRDFDDRDVHSAPMTAIVNEALARRALPGQDAIGHKVVCAFDTIAPMTIIGVVADVRQSGPSNTSQPECYMPYLQHGYNGATLSLVMRTTTDPMSLANTVRLKAKALAPGVPVRFTTLEALTSQNVAEPKFRAMVISVFAAVALALAIVGVFGVMAYVVSQRRREIGMRLALGATRGDIIQLFLRRGMALTMAGLAIGLVGAAIISRSFESLLFATQPTDPATYLLVSSLLAFAALTAVYVPARRASRFDPMVALRYE